MPQSSLSLESLRERLKVVEERQRAKLIVAEVKDTFEKIAPSYTLSMPSFRVMSALDNLLHVSPEKVAGGVLEGEKSFSASLFLLGEEGLLGGVELILAGEPSPYFTDADGRPILYDPLLLVVGSSRKDKGMYAFEAGEEEMAVFASFAVALTKAFEGRNYSRALALLEEIVEKGLDRELIQLLSELSLGR